MREFEKILKRLAIVFSILALIGLIGSGISFGNFDFNSGFMGKDIFNKVFNSNDNLSGNSETKNQGYEDMTVLLDGNTQYSKKVIDKNIKNININQDIGHLTIEEVESLNEKNESINIDGINVYTTDESETKIDTKGENLNITMTGNGGVSNLQNFIEDKKSKRGIVIEVPKGTVINEIKINNNCGNINIREINCKNIDLNLKSGVIDIASKNYILMDNIKIESKEGDTILKNVDAVVSSIVNDVGSTYIEIENKKAENKKNLTIENHLGNVTAILNNIDRNINIENNMGNITLKSKNKASSNVNINASNEMGNINNTIQKDNTTLKNNVNVNLNCQVGNIDIGN